MNLRQHARTVVAAVLSVALSAAAFQAAVHRPIRVVTIPVAEHVERPAQRVMRLRLTGLSQLNGSAAILTGVVRNLTAAPQRIRVMLGDVPRAEVEASADREERFTVLLALSVPPSLDSEVDGGLPILLVGSSDQWQVHSVRVSTAYAALGPVAALVPDGVSAEAPFGWLVWTALLMAGILLVGASGPGLTGHPHVDQLGAAASAALLAVLWIVPLTSDRRVLISLPVYGLLVALLFSSVTRLAGRAAATVVASLAQAVLRFGRRHAQSYERGGIFLGLVAMAVAQPLFDVLAGSPEFFVARNTTATVAGTAVALVVVGIPSVLFGIERTLRVVSPRFARLFVAAITMLLVALLVHPWLRRGVPDEPAVIAAVALAGGALAGWLTWRSQLMRTFLAFLAPAAVIVPVAFLSSRVVTESFTAPPAALPSPPLARTPPIVVLVFDEFPVHSLLDGEQQIDQVRYPGFAALANNASWYRDATTVSSETVWAVPAIVSGRYPLAPNAVPTLRYYPENLFTWLAARYRMHVFGRFLQLCPAPSCVRDNGGAADGPLSLLVDFGLVWLHIVLPGPLTDRLPPVVGDWMGFVRAARWRVVDGQRVRNDRLGEFDRFLTAIDRAPGRLYFLHSLLPHMPFEYVPSGRRYDAPDYQGRRERGATLFEKADPAYADAAHQRHLLQVGFVDRLVKRLLDRLHALGIYDDALVVVAADHGASYREGHRWRTVQTGNMSDIMRVPLFVKRPGQTKGGVVGGAAETVDILPTVADALGVSLPFAVDGRPLGTDPRPDRSRTFVSRTLTEIDRQRVDEWADSTAASISRRIARFGAGSDDGLYAVPGAAGLLGRSIAAPPEPHPTVRATVTNLASFREVDVQSDTLPLHVRGRVNGATAQPLAIAVNGRIAAITSVYEERGAHVFATMIPETALRPGRNDVAVYSVEPTGTVRSLAPLR